LKSLLLNVKRVAQTSDTHDATASSRRLHVLAALSITDATADPSATCASDDVIVFDASGSMAASDFRDGAPSRIDRARQALAKILPPVSKARNLA
jgi:hypothetical protein